MKANLLGMFIIRVNKKMLHLVYCNNTGKKYEKVLDKILSGTKTVIVHGAAGRKISL